MKHHRRSWLPWLMGALVLAVCSGCQDHTQPLAPDGLDDLSVLEGRWDGHTKDPLKVMSRNVYWGGDFNIIMGADFSDPFDIAARVTQTWEQFEGNMMYERAVALVDEIEAEEPHLVGFQEVVQVILFTYTEGFGYVPTVFDFVGILEAEINARQLPYSFVGVQDNTFVELPKTFGPVPGGVAEFVWFTDRIAMLAHDDLGIDPLTDVFKDNYGPPFAGAGPLELLRGWIRAEFEWNGVPHHFVNTHMETQQATLVQEADAGQLMGLLEPLDGITVLVGDFNSNAEGQPGDPTVTATYGMLVDGGFVDAWELDPHNQNLLGLTCCHDNDLSVPFTPFYQRVDLVLLRDSGHPGKGGNLPGRFSMEILGEEPGDQTSPSGLWPSDHAGVSADIWFAPGQFVSY